MGLVKQWLIEQANLEETPAQPLKPRLPIPDATRDAVRTRANGGCEQCTVNDVPLEFHHLHYNTQGRERPQDLELLCRSCHSERHRDFFGQFWVDPVEMRHHWGCDPWCSDLDDVPGW
jgi:hypothetical protein